MKSMGTKFCYIIAMFIILNFTACGLTKDDKKENIASKFDSVFKEHMKNSYSTSKDTITQSEPLLSDSFTISSTEAEKLIDSQSREIILALKNKDMKKLANFVHPDRGVCFSPWPIYTEKYTTIEEAYTSNGNKNIKEWNVFSKQQTPNLFSDKNKYYWGQYDGSGDSINLTFTDYYKQFVYNEDFIKSPKVVYNKRLGSDGTIAGYSFNFINKSIRVEFESLKKGEMGWSRLYLEFVLKDNEWYLVGIVHDAWTI